MNFSYDSPYLYFNRNEWAELRNNEPMTLSEEELQTLRGINDEMSMSEVIDIYLPLSRLLSYYYNAQINRQTVLSKFLNRKNQKIPFIVGIAGSVSVGKSTIARVLQTLLSRWKENTKVDLVTTDGFLYPNEMLECRGLSYKKGFPESYDIKQLLQFVTDIKSGKPNLQVPVYSHLIYDIVPNKYHTIDQPDILIIEGLNVLQSSLDYKGIKPKAFVSDFVDFSIYVDTEEELIEKWFIDRFFKFRSSAFADPESFFHAYSKISEEEALKISKEVWKEINHKNLVENILPTRERASLIVHKSDNHAVDYVRLRK